MRAEPYRKEDDGLRDWMFRPHHGLTAYPFRPATDRKARWPGRTLLIIVAFVLGVICGATFAGAEPCVRLQVRPRVMISRGDIDVQMRVARHADHHSLDLMWTSDAGSEGSSHEDLAGDQARVPHQLWLRDQPAAIYDFEATVRDPAGHMTGRDRARILSPHEETF